MFRFLAVIYFLFLASFIFAQTSTSSFEQIAKSFEVKQAKTDILNEEEDIKKLILKYESAPKEQKENIKKEIIKLQTKKEEEALARQEKRIERQEKKVKQLKEDYPFLLSPGERISLKCLSLKSFLRGSCKCIHLSYVNLVIYTSQET